MKQSALPVLILLGVCSSEKHLHVSFEITESLPERLSLLLRNVLWHASAQCVLDLAWQVQPLSPVYVSSDSPDAAHNA